MRSRGFQLIHRNDIASLIKSHIAIHEASGNTAAVAALKALLVAIEEKGHYDPQGNYHHYNKSTRYGHHCAGYTPLHFAEYRDDCL